LFQVFILFELKKKLFKKVGELVGYQCDQYVSEKVKSFEKEKISKTIQDSLTCKARLLYYFPKNEEIKKKENESFDDWCMYYLKLSFFNNTFSKVDGI